MKMQVIEGVTDYVRWGFLFGDARSGGEVATSVFCRRCGEQVVRACAPEEERECPNRTMLRQVA